MKHITFAEKSLFIGDEAAELVLEYASLLAAKGDADTVRLNAVSSDGNEVEATLLLDAGAPLMAESTNSSQQEPDNAEVVRYMRERVMLLSSPPPVRPQDESMPSSYEDLNL